MVFMGSKDRLSKEICPIIQKYIDETNTKVYIEPFVGGANVIDKIQCIKRIGIDINLPLITLLKYIQNHPDIPIAPEDVSFEHYADVRSNQNTGKYSPEYVSLIGYCASYGGRYFDGGYGRDAKGDRCVYKERLKNLKEQAPRLNGIKFYNHNYKDITDIKNAVIYCDPPYKGVKKYSKQQINYEEFYDWCRKYSKNNTVIVSEFEMPDGFKCIWEKPRKILQKSDRVNGITKVEKLFIVEN